MQGRVLSRCSDACWVLRAVLSAVLRAMLSRCRPCANAWTGCWAGIAARTGQPDRRLRAARRAPHGDEFDMSSTILRLMGAATEIGAPLRVPPSAAAAIALSPHIACIDDGSFSDHAHGLMRPRCTPRLNTLGTMANSQTPPASDCQ